METELFWYYLKRIFKKPGERLRYLELEEARKKLNEQEKYLVEWAEEKNIYLITGHSHQPYINHEKNTCILEREIDNIANRQIPDIEAKLKMLKTGERVEIDEVEGDRKSLYFNDGCCFAANIISAIELVYNDHGTAEGGWYICLVCWDIMDEKKPILARDNYNEIKKKTKKRILGSQKLNL